MENLRIKANGVELEVNHYPNNGETIVFLHFSGGCLAQWNGIIPNFMEKYNIVTLDLRGHGKSEKAGSGYTLDNMGKDIIEVMNQLGIDKTHLVGSSLGGEIAVSLAANYSHRIKSVVAEGAIQNYFGENGVCDIPVEEIPHKKIELRTAREKKIMPIFHSLQEKIEFSKQNFMEGGQWGEAEEMEYIVAVTNFVDAPNCNHIPVIEGVEEFSYPSATWAIFEANGELPEATQRVYKQFYTEWLPNSGYDLADLPVIECYMQENKQEVWIAVIKKLP